MNNKPFSEIVESSLYGWIAQSWQWDRFPPFAEIMSVQTPNRTVLGIVHEIQTNSMDPVRYPFPFQKTHEELLREQPQIFEFLRTSFSCISVGYYQKEKIFHLLAPEPPAMHSFVHGLSEQMTGEFFSNANYLHLLFSLADKISNLNELLLALLKRQSDLGILTADRLDRFVDVCMLYKGNDYRHLKLFLNRVENILS